MASAGSLIGYGTFRYLLFSASLSASLHLQPCAFAELLHTPRAAFAGRKISHYRTEVVVGWRIAHQIDVGLREARVLRLRLIIDCSAAGHRQRDDDVDLVALLFLRDAPAARCLSSNSTANSKPHRLVGINNQITARYQL